jgi:hypothetical protein
MLFLLALCLLCIGGGIQSALAFEKWLSGDRFWADALKAGSLLLFAVAVFARLSQAISK